MLIFLIFGIILGAISVIFVLQNIVPVTVTFFAWHLDGSLATLLFLALMTGMLIALLTLVPTFIKHEVALSRLKKRNKDLEEELTVTQRNLKAVATAPAAQQVPPQA